jgi:hypothetical protein
VPSPEELRSIVEESFWATLRPDERRYPRLGLLFCGPDSAIERIVLERPKALSSRKLD